MDSLQKLKQKAYWLAYDHLASTKPARLLFFTGGGESYNPENELAERQKEMAEKGLEDELAAEFKAMSNIVESAIREGLTSAEETMIRTQMDTLLDSKITNLERVQQEKGATLERLNYIKTHENLRKAFSKLNDKQFQALTNLIETAESSIQAGNLDPKNPPDLNAANALESAWMNSDHKALGITRPGLKKVRSAAQNLVAKLEASALDNVTDEEVDEFEFEGFDPDTGAELPPEDDAPSPIDEEPTPEQDQVLAALEEEESTVEKTPEQLRAELLEQGLIRQLELNEMQFLLHNMAANHGMTENQLRQLNNKLSPRLNIKNATDGSGAYVYAEDIVYVYTSTENAIQAEIALGFREPPPQPEEIVTGEDVARAEREGQIFEAELAEEMYGQEGARIESTRQSLLEQNGLASRRASLTGTLLNRDSNLTLDSSMHNPFPATRTLGLMNGLMNEGGTWESFKPLWNHVDGRNAVENWLEEQSTFELADYDLENYLITLAKKEGFAIQKDLQDISFEKLIDSVYGSGMSGESLIIALAAQAGVGIDNSFRGKKRKELTEEDKRIKGILRNIQGDFRNDYDRMLDTLTLEISEKTYVGNGEVDITLQKADGTEAITARVPLHHVVQLQEGDLDVPLADKTEQDIQDLIDNRPESPIFVGPTGNLLALDGTNLTNNVTDGDFTKLSEEFKTERAIVAAMETIYQDVAELYDRTADLSFVDSGADESYQQRVTRARVEAFRALEGHGVAVANFGDTLDSALITGEYAGRNAEALGFIRRGGELTYEDTETGGKFIVTNEEIFDYYDGAAVVDDILDEFLTEEVSHGGKKETFNVQKGMKFLNNKLITIALRTNQELIDKYGGSSDDPEIRFQTAFRALKVKKESIIPTEGTPLVPLTADQITLIQEGYMIHSTVREAKQITEGKEAVEALATSVTELRFKLNEEQIAGLVESIVSTNPEWDNPHNRAIIAGQLRIGAGLGTLTTVDRGHQHTTTTITKVDGEVVDISSKSENLRESSIDTLFTVGLGISPINISGLDPDGRGKFNVGFSGGVNLRTGSPSAAMGVRYSVEFKNGIEVYVDGGVGTNIATLGGGVIIPAGEARIDLHGHIYPGGVELGGAVTFGNLQHSFTRDLTEAFTDNGFKDIDTALEENGGAPSREMVDMILATDDFKAVAGPYEQIFGDLGIKNARDNEFFQEFIL
ncbi:hypothetical protein HN680_00635, partial [Candidatus Peregrinibacteria bacterium]|nr:hypothetical protein [Candidatus Peregrinibacteria bacterium]